MDKAALLARKRELQEKANKAKADAEQFRGEMFAAEGGWPQDKEEQFDRAIADYHESVIEIQGIDGKLEKLDQLDSMERFDATPATRVQHSGAETATQLAVDEAEKQAYRRAMITYVRHGMDALGVRERHALTAGSSTAAGFMLDEDFRAEVIKAQAGIAVVRSAGARVVPTGRGRVVWPRITAGTDPYSSDFAGGWKAETSDGATLTRQNKPTGDTAEIPVNKWQPDAIELTEELLEDTEVPLEMILAELIAESKSLGEDYAFLLGDGSNKPVGILDAASSITTVASGVAAALSYDGLVDLHVGLPAQYRQNATYLMASTTHGAVLKLKDGEDRPLYPVGQPINQLFTRPILFSEFIPEIEADSLSIIFGDFRRGYTIVERRELRIQRLVERFAPNVGLLPTARLGGKVVLPQAFRVQKIEE